MVGSVERAILFSLPSTYIVDHMACVITTTGHLHTVSESSSSGTRSGKCNGSDNSDDDKIMLSADRLQFTVDVDNCPKLHSTAEDVPSSLEQRLRICFAVVTGWMRLLTLDVMSWTRQSFEDGDGDVLDVVELAAHLSSVGYIARVCHTSASETNKYLYSSVNHTFITVKNAYESDAEAVVDPHFREQFFIPRPTDRYTKILRIVPEVFVGKFASMVCGARYVCKELERSFAANGMSLPPWRNADSILARWITAAKNDEYNRKKYSSEQPYLFDGSRIRELDIQNQLGRMVETSQSRLASPPRSRCNSGSERERRE